MAAVALLIAAIVAWVYSWPLWAEVLLTVLAAVSILAEADAN